MKTNLSNKPEIIVKVTGHFAGIPRALWVNPEKAAVWFEEFEKELTKRLSDLEFDAMEYEEKKRKAEKEDSPSEVAAYEALLNVGNGIMVTIKEILGEE